MSAPQPTLGRVIGNFITHGTSMPRDRRKSLYRSLTLGALAMIWLPTVALLLLRPAPFVSEWTLLVPVSGAGHAVQLENVGQASLPTSMPFSNSSVDPRVNYREILLNETVLRKAARSMQMTPAEFGKPRVKLVDQTAAIRLKVEGRSAEEAQAKAQMLHRALEEELARLRSDEIGQRETITTAALSSFSDKLATAQGEILAFQAQSRILSLEHFRDLSIAIERVRQDRAELKARRDGLRARIAKLEADLGIPEGQAGKVLDLQNDAEFLRLMDASAIAARDLSEAQARLGERHFKVVAARATDSELRLALQRRASRIGASVTDTARLALLANSGNTRELVQSLVELSSELSGIEAEIVSSDAQIESLKLRVDEGARDALTLERLLRKEQVATAVFSTALAKLDLGRTDTFASYPMVQTLTPPSLPDQPETLGRTLATAGAVLASLFVLFAMSLLWIRKPILQRIFTNA